MFRRSTLLPVSAALGAAALVLAAGPASAATTYTIKAGTQTSGTTTYTAATTGASPQVKFQDVTSGLALSCLSSTAAGSVKLGKGLAAAGLGSIASTTWTGCKGPLSLDMKVTQSGSWAINGAGTTSSTGVTPVTVSNVSAVVAATAGGCSFTVSGVTKGKLTAKGTQQFLQVVAAGTQLKISNVSGCFGQITAGDKASIVAKYKVKAAAGLLTVTTP